MSLTLENENDHRERASQHNSLDTALSMLEGYFREMADNNMVLGDVIYNVVPNSVTFKFIICPFF